MAKDMIRGAPDVLYSAFHLGYSMLLGLMRVEGAEPEQLMAASFRWGRRRRRWMRLTGWSGEGSVRLRRLRLPRRRGAYPVSVGGRARLGPLERGAGQPSPHPTCVSHAPPLPPQPPTSNLTYAFPLLPVWLARFRQFQVERSLPSLEARVTSLEAAREAIAVQVGSATTCCAKGT
jgi:hypothetical protein